MSMNLDTRLKIVKLYYKHGESATAALRSYKNANRLHKNPFSRQSVIKLIKKFESTKSFQGIIPSGRPSQLSSRKQVVADSLAQLQSRTIHGHASTSAVSRDTGIPQRSVARIVRSWAMHPYKMTLCQEITDTDKTARMNFARWIQDNENSLEKIVWSDEAYFTLD